MRTLLFIDCCLRGSGSRTEALAREYLTLRRISSPYRLQTADPYALSLAPLSADELERRGQPQKNAGGVCDLALQFAAADEIVVATPYYDLSFSSALKVYLEHVSVCGIAFRYEEAGSIGLCRASRVTYITTAGGFIGDRDFGSTYVQALCAMFGITDFRRVSAEGLDIEGADVPACLEPARRQIADLAR